MTPPASEKSPAWPVIRRECRVHVAGAAWMPHSRLMVMSTSRSNGPAVVLVANRLFAARSMHTTVDS